MTHDYSIHSCGDTCQRRACVLRRELTAVTEQLDGLRAGIDYATDQLTKVTEQRDRLAEALRKAISWGLCASHRILDRENINWTYLNEAGEALQSLNQPTETKTK